MNVAPSALASKPVGKTAKSALLAGDAAVRPQLTEHSCTVTRAFLPESFDDSEYVLV
jgi:hypothetical protein